MTNAVVLFVLVVLALAAFSWLAAWSRRGESVRWVIMAMFLLAPVPLAIGLSRSLGTPVPLWLAPDLDGASVIRAVFRPGEAIYVFVVTASLKPLLVAMPWDQGKAERTQRLLDDRRMSRVVFRRGKALGTEGNFAYGELEPHGIPQPPMPPKE